MAKIPKPGPGALVLIMTLAAVPAALAQDAAGAAPSFAAGSLRDVDPGTPGSTAFLQGGESDHRFSASFRIEFWEAPIEVTGSDNNMGIPDSEMEAGTEFAARHTIGLLCGEYGYYGSKSFVLKAHAGLGWERLGILQEADDSNALGPYDNDVTFERSLAYEIGASFRYLFESVDVGLGALFRGGSGDRDYSDSPAEESYDYMLFRITLEGGLRATEGVRVFLGLHYTLYMGEYNLSGGAGQELTFECEFDRPFGISVGVDLEGGKVAGRFEIMIADVNDLGFAASLGWRF